jgi:hypothetical protein
MDHAISPEAAQEACRSLDKFMTRPEVASHFFEVLCARYPNNGCQFIEPSAGSGSFLRLLPPGSVGYDISPDAEGIIRADFLKLDLCRTGRIVMIGNPPFGKNSSLAVKFFNRAALVAEAIAFILPRTFKKHSIQSRLDPFFHLEYEELVADDSFEFCGKIKNVPTAFQIWVRQKSKRMISRLPTSHPDFEFLPTANGASFAIQRVGKDAGRVHRNFSRSPNAHYFIRALTPGVEDIMRSLDFAGYAGWTAGNPSIGKREIVELYVDAVSGAAVN